MSRGGRPTDNQNSFIHFPRTLFLSFVLIALMATSLFYWFGKYDENDRQSYEKLIAGDERTVKGNESKTSKQSRSNLQKSLFFGSGDQRRQLRLHGSTAELALEKSGRKIAIVEYMQGIEGWMQEKLHIAADGKEKQDILHFTGTKGTYHYVDEKLFADDVHLTRYTVEGHDLDLIPYSDPVSIEQSKMNLVADHASYTEHTLALTGAVNGKSPNGIFKAEKVIIDQPGSGAKAEAAQIEMEGNVEVELAGHGVLTCAKATIDPATFSGVFIKGSEGIQAQYAEKLSSREGEPKLFIVAADRLEGQMVNTDQEGQKSGHRAIDRLTGSGSVLIAYDADFTARGDKAVFINEPIQGNNELAGTIGLTSEGTGKQCSVTDSSGNVIRAAGIDIDIAKRTSLFHHPDGQLNSLGEAAGDVEFSADAMVWDDRIMTLILTGNIDLVQHGVGKLQTDKELTVVLHKVDGKKAVRTLEAQGNSTLTYIDAEKSLDHTLKCYGRIKIDHLKQESQLHSPKDAEGNVVEGQQVYFQDEKGELFADRAFIKYETIDKKLTPIRIVLEGNVKIINTLAKSNDDTTFTQQYILADRVDFIPQSKEMIFKAEKGRRVLLYDKNNNMEVSAPTLKLVRDHAANKESLQSIGGVRLNFVEGELEQLRQHFKLDKKGLK